MIPLNRSRSVDVVTCINLWVLTRFFEKYAIRTWYVKADTGILLAEITILKFFWQEYQYIEERINGTHFVGICEDLGIS